MGTKHSNLARKESNARRKPKHRKKSSDSNSRYTFQKSNSTATDTSLNSLIFKKFEPKEFRKRSIHSVSSAENKFSAHHYTSDTSTVHSNSFKNKFFHTTKKKKNNKDQQQQQQPAIVVGDDEEGGSFLSPSSASPSILTTNDIISNRSPNLLEDDDPMIVAAAKLSAKFDKEQAAILSRHSYSPCMVTQYAEFRLDSRYCPRLSIGDSDLGYYSTNSIQSSSPLSHPILANQIAYGLKPLLPKEDATSRKLNKEWLDTTLSSAAVKKKISSQDVFLDLFLRPCNALERRKEKDRQQRLHYLLKGIWKGIYRAKLDKPKVIVNWCCGIGVWDMEMALLFPHAKIIGVDFKEATLNNLQHDLPNLEFRHTVIHDTYTGMESFETDSVDYIMMRDVWLVNTPSFKWRNVLKEALRILKPGGWIELTEHILCIESQGPVTSRLDECFGHFFQATQVDREIALKLGQYLRDAGYADVDEESVTVPLGEWGSTPALRECGYLFGDIMERRIRGLSKWVCIANNIDAKELSDIISTGMEEELNSYHSCLNWLSYTARKKVNTSTPCLVAPPSEENVVSTFKRARYLDSTASQSMPNLQNLPSTLPLAPSTPPLIKRHSSTRITAHLEGSKCIFSYEDE